MKSVESIYYISKTELTPVFLNRDCRSTVCIQIDTQKKRGRWRTEKTSGR